MWDNRVTSGAFSSANGDFQAIVQVRRVLASGRRGPRLATR
jgi:hypothetical protein